MNLASLIDRQNHKLTSNELVIHERALRAGARHRESMIAILHSIAEVDGARLYLKFEMRSTFQYATELMKLSEDVAVNAIAIARKSREVPALMDAIESGVSISNARVIVPVLSPQNADEWLTKARTLSKANLEKAVVKVKPSEAVKTKVKPVAEGQYKLELGIPEDLFEKLKRVQDIYSQSKQRHVDLAEALTAMSDFFLHHKDPLEKAKRAKIIRPGADNQRRKRSPIPAAAKHAVHRRDQGQCQAQTPSGQCKETRWTHIHHKHEVQHGGTNDPANLTTLCSHHHREHHRKTGHEHRYEHHPEQHPEQHRERSPEHQRTDAPAG